MRHASNAHHLDVAARLLRRSANNLRRQAAVRPAEYVDLEREAVALDELAERLSAETLVDQ
jgi:hypothetical protein